MRTLYTDPCPLHRVQRQWDGSAVPLASRPPHPRAPTRQHRHVATHAVREDGDKDLDRIALLAMYATHHCKTRKPPNKTPATLRQC